MTATISRHIVEWYKQTYPNGAADIEEWLQENEIKIEGVDDGSKNRN